MRKIIRQKIMPLLDGSIPEISFIIKSGGDKFPYLHDHEYWEIMLVHTGIVRQDIRGKSYNLYENDICILQPKTVHTVCEDTDKPLKWVNFEIDTHFFETFLGNLSKKELEIMKEKGIVLGKLEKEDVNRVFEKLWVIGDLQEDGEERKTWRLKALLAEIILNFISSKKKAKPLKELPPIVREIFEQFSKEENLKKHFKDICRELNYVEEYVIRVFKKAGLLSPNKYFTEKRLERACRLLETTDMQVLDIMETVGYQSLSHFNRIFKERFGCTPTQYRKRKYKSK